MGKDTSERGTVRRPKAADGITVKEAMMKRDADLDLAMHALRAAAEEVTASFTKLMRSIVPKASFKPAKAGSGRGVAENANSLESFGLAHDIHSVAHQLHALQSAVDKTCQARSRRARKSAAPPGRAKG